MSRKLRIGIVIPALNEEESIGRVLQDIPPVAEEIVVVDNGSTDATAQVAQHYGARVVAEPQRGYGAACLAGIAALVDVDVVVFLDADYSDRPQDLCALLEPIQSGAVDLVVGSRVRGRAAPGSLTLPQRVGNALACILLRIFFGVTYTDLGPFRAIRRDALSRLEMSDRDYGWTVQMQARAARVGLWSVEVPVSYRPRVGRSKISGTVRGVIGAGTKIIGTILWEALRGRRVPRVRASDTSSSRASRGRDAPECGSFSCLDRTMPRFGGGWVHHVPSPGPAPQPVEMTALSRRVGETTGGPDASRVRSRSAATKPRPPGPIGTDRRILDQTCEPHAGDGACA